MVLVSSKVSSNFVWPGLLIVSKSARFTYMVCPMLAYMVLGQNVNHKSGSHCTVKLKSVIQSERWDGRLWTRLNFEFEFLLFFAGPIYIFNLSWADRRMTKFKSTQPRSQTNVLTCVKCVMSFFPILTTL